MPGRIDDNVRLEAIWQWILGNRMEDIATKFNISYGAVRTIIDELRQGRYPQYQSYLPYLNDLHWLSQQLRAKSRSLQQAIGGNILLETLLKLGVDPAELEQLLKLLRRISPAGFPAEAFARAALRLAELEQTGIDFTEIEKKVVGLRSEVPSLEAIKEGLTKSIDSLRSNEQETRADLDRTLSRRKHELQQLEQAKTSQLANNKLTEQQLTKHLQVQDALASHGVNFDKLDPLLKVLNEFEKYGMQPKAIIEYIRKISGLSEEAELWNQRVELTKKELSGSRASLETVNNQVATARAEQEKLGELKIQRLAELDQTKEEYDRNQLPIDLAETFLHLLNDPSKTTDQQLITMSDTLQGIVRTRKTMTKEFLIDYERPRQLMIMLVETVAGKKLVWKETQESELTALRNQNSDLQLGYLRKLENVKREQRMKQAELEQQKRALGEAAEDKVLEVALAHVKKGVIFMGKCTRCQTKSAIIPGSKPSYDSYYTCPSCLSSLKPLNR